MEMVTMATNRIHDNYYVRLHYDCAAAALLGRGDMLGVTTGELDTATALFTADPPVAGQKEKHS